MCKLRVSSVILSISVIFSLLLLGAHAIFIPDQYLFSNSPEKVLSTGMLLSGYLPANRSMTLYFYHLNVSKRELYMRFILKLDRAEGKIMYDTYWKYSRKYIDVGHELAVQMLRSSLSLDLFQLDDLEIGMRREIKSLGWWERVNENTYYLQVPFKTSELLIGYLSLFSDTKLHYSLWIVDDPEKRTSELELINPRIIGLDSYHQRGLIWSPHLYQRVIFRTSISREEVTIGEAPVEGITTEGDFKLKGNYGVIYLIDLSLINDSSDSREVNIWFNPRGGPARITMLLLPKDGTHPELVSTPTVNSYKLYRLRNIELKPGELRMYRLVIIPEGASCYPIKLIFK